VADFVAVTQVVGCQVTSQIVLQADIRDVYKRLARRWAISMKCPMHGRPLLIRRLEVRTGYYNVLRKVMHIGYCSVKTCRYEVDLNLDYNIVMQEPTW
jgi:hypothetical protein